MNNTPTTPEQDEPTAAPAPKAKKPRSNHAALRAGRSKARGFALQSIYQYMVGGNDTETIDKFTRELDGFDKCNYEHYDALFLGCIERASELDAHIAPLLDRGWDSISPVEHACMQIGVFEFKYCPDVPWRVVLNECIELAKSFGGTDGHRYVNGILHT